MGDLEYFVLMEMFLDLMFKENNKTINKKIYDADKKIVVIG